MTPIAVVIVCRNAYPAVADTVAAVQRLADPRVRLFVVDGASSDGTVPYLQSVSGSLAGLVSEADHGIYDAMNKGWRLAPDDAYVLYLGAGDQVVELPRDDELHDPQGRPWPIVMGECLVGDRVYRPYWGMRLRVHNTVHHQALMVHKSIWPQPPFDASLRVYGDWDFNLRLFRRGFMAEHIPSLRATALPGGVSWRADFREIHEVARRHSGPLLAAVGTAALRFLAWRGRRRNA